MIGWKRAGLVLLGPSQLRNDVVVKEKLIALYLIGYLKNGSRSGRETRVLAGHFRQASSQPKTHLRIGSITPSTVRYCEA